MEYAEIVEKVKAIIVDKLGVEPSEVTETANFTNDLGADSLDILKYAALRKVRDVSPQSAMSLYT